MATTLSAGVAALARQVALDQIAQDIDMNSKLGQKANQTDLTELQSTVSGMSGQVATAQETASAASADAKTANDGISSIRSEVIALCKEISGG